MGIEKMAPEEAQEEAERIREIAEEIGYGEADASDYEEANEIVDRQNGLSPEQLDSLEELKARLVAMSPQELFTFLSTIAQNGIESTDEIMEKKHDQEINNKEIEEMADEVIFGLL
jgi:hypothetical protein